MSKLSVFLLSLVLMATSLVNAQIINIGAQGCMSIPNLSAGVGNQNPMNTGYSSKLDYDGAIFAEIEFSELFSLQPGIAYSSQGGKKEGIQAFPTPTELKLMYPDGHAPQYLYANYKNEASLDYLMLPIHAQFGIRIKESPFKLYAGIGPFVSMLLSAKQISSGQSQLYSDQAAEEILPGGVRSFDNTQNIKEQLHRFNVGIDGSLGVKYSFGKHNVFVEAGGNYGFINIQKDKKNGKNYTGAGVFAIGYAYRLTRKQTSHNKQPQ